MMPAGTARRTMHDEATSTDHPGRRPDMSEAPAVAGEPVCDTVLLVMDVQSMIVAPAPPEMLEAVARAIAGARAAEVPVVYVRVALRPGRAGVSPAEQAAHEAARGAHRGSAQASNSTRPSPRSLMTSC